MATVTAGFGIREETLQKRLREMIVLVHDDLVGRFVRSQVAGCGRIFDATVADRGRRAGR
jgi:hypothetical protein